MGFLGLGEDAHLQLKRRRVKNIEGPQRRVLKGGRWRGVADESQVVVLEDEFWRFVTAKKNEFEALRSHIPLALGDCVDPVKFVLEAILEVFLVDKRVEMSDKVCAEERGCRGREGGGRGS
ncbi:hypothetical protein DVH24_013316 [Malus domestica]|uniref:FRIGIDA-like protein n=1 Tax=Malus domestica TaxID=3750 RepID=A0A498HIN6_MALDO|nr:hypothetical protein DVH24_013316 [Malus domestica]